MKSNNSSSGTRLPAFDPADFEIDPTVEIPVELLDPECVLKRLDPSRATKLAPEATLFGQQAETHATATDSEFKTWELVRRAFVETCDKKSADFVIADPESNVRFLSRCWSLGVRASQFDLNWLLINARKDGRFKELDSAERFVLSRQRSDQFIFAADIAMKLLRDDYYFKKQTSISVDRILCDPTLTKEFDRLAATIAPGHETLLYRWAAVSIRKARRTARGRATPPKFAEECGLADLIVSRLPTAAGLFWVRTENCSLFWGVASSLRSQLDHFVGCLRTPKTLELLKSDAVRASRISYMEMPVGLAEDLRTGLLGQQQSSFNFMQNCPLFPSKATG
jgi:hypothetical protein